MDPQVQKKRLIAMLVFCGVCTVVAIASAVGALVYRIDWMLFLFFAAIGAGFLAQGWLMLGLTKATRDAKGPPK